MRRRAFLASPALLVAALPAFRNEWWYVTGWLEDASGHVAGFQVTFFRHRPGVAEDNPSRFAAHELLFAHGALADPRYGKLRHDQRAARAGFDIAAALDATTDVWIGDWSLQLIEGSYRARIAARDFHLDLRFAPTQAVLLQGDAGVSRKGPSPRQASYYYSQPQLAVTGQVATANNDATVTGTAWLDHEWSSEYMAREAAAFWAGGSHRTADGRVRSFAPAEIQFTPQRRWRSPRTQVDYPIAMDVRAGDVECVLEPLMDDQELDAMRGIGTIYWEGAVRALRSGRGIGRGYLELTGYGKPLKL